MYLQLKCFMLNGKVTLEDSEKTKLETFVNKEDVLLMYHIIWNYFTNEKVEDIMSIRYCVNGRDDVISVGL